LTGRNEVNVLSGDDKEKEEQDKNTEYRDATWEEVKKSLEKVLEEHDELFRKLADS
jgi:hypothetical protein